MAKSALLIQAIKYAVYSGIELSGFFDRAVVAGASFVSFSSEREGETFRRRGDAIYKTIEIMN